MEETKTEFIHAVSERFKNPIYLTFAISFLLFNWKPILLVLKSDRSIEFLIHNIEVFHVNWIANLLYPLVSTFLVLFIFPNLQLLLDFINKPTEKTRLRLAEEKAGIEYQIAAKRAGTMQIGEISDQRDHFSDLLEREHEKTMRLEDYNSELEEEVKNSTEALNFLKQEKQQLLEKNSALNENLERMKLYRLESETQHIKYRDMHEEITSFRKQMNPKYFNIDTNDLNTDTQLALNIVNHIKEKLNDITEQNN